MTPSISANPRRLHALSLFAATLLLFLGAIEGGFILLDDDAYITANPHVQAGLSAASLRWAIAGSATYIYYQPLTWISHLIDVSLYGLSPQGHHFTNVFLHACNTVLLYLALHMLTGMPGASLFAASLWAFNPLRVESVAWVAERKDVLSGFFWMLALLAYARYCRNTRNGANSGYWAVIACHAAALLSKPTTVTLPFVLLLLDYWPLGRLQPFAARLREKIPLFALSLAASILTYIGQAESGATMPLDRFPLALRLENALVSYAVYLYKTFVPRSLAVLYPYPDNIPLSQLAFSAVFLTAIAIGVYRANRGYLTVGLLWFLGAMVPMIGIVQAGPQAMADRFTYLPGIGLAVALSFTLAPWTHRWKRPLAVAVLAAMAILTYRQIGLWRDTQTLFAHSLEVAPGAAILHVNLGHMHLAEGRIAEAAGELREAVRLSPRNYLANFNLGAAEYKLQRMEPAREAYTAAAALHPNSAEAHFWIGMCLRNLGRTTEAIESYRSALQLGLSGQEAEVARNNIEALHQNR